MSARSGRVRWRILVFVASLLPAALLAATPTAALAAPAVAQTECSGIYPDDPWLRSDGWRVYVRGGGIAFCDGYAGVRVQLKQHVPGWFDRTIATRDGRENQRLEPERECREGSYHEFYVEMKVYINGDEHKVQSGRTTINADC
jgi:hypothetical protein